MLSKRLPKPVHGPGVVCFDAAIGTAHRCGRFRDVQAFKVAQHECLPLTPWQGQMEPLTEGGFDVTAVADLEILLSQEELDMLEELEFYAWLEEQVELTSGEIVEDGIG